MEWRERHRRNPRDDSGPDNRGRFGGGHRPQNRICLEPGPIRHRGRARRLLRWNLRKSELQHLQRRHGWVGHGVDVHLGRLAQVDTIGGVERFGKCGQGPCGRLELQQRYPSVPLVRRRSAWKRAINYRGHRQRELSVLGPRVPRRGELSPRRATRLDGNPSRRRLHPEGEGLPGDENINVQVLTPPSTWTTRLTIT